MTFHLAIFAVDVVGVFTVLLIGLRLLVANPLHGSSLLLACICFDSACARLLARHEYRSWIPEALRIEVGSLEIVLNLARNLTPGLFLLVCHRLFQEQQPLPRWLVAVFLVQVFAEDALPAMLGISVVDQHSALEVVPALLQLLLLGFAFGFIVKGWQMDLVENRRRLRFMFLFIVGSYVFAVVLLERLAISWSQPFLFEIHVWLSVFGALLACVALFALFGTQISAFVDPCRIRHAVENRQAAERNASDLARLQSALREDFVYRDSTLTLGSLARRLKLPEYRLRALIHERLGYRNFNALLHDYRIKEVSAALSDPQRREVPILTIALSAGYNSVNPFNRAFREANGATPSAFRARALRDVLSNSKK